jgi:WD40 repeat protein
MSVLPAGFYITSGTLAGSTPSYVVRAADDLLFRAISDSEYCYVLSSRQMGKSSLMIRTANRLQAEGVAVAVLDLTRLGSNVTANEWYNGLLEQLGSRLKLRAEARAFAAEHADHGPLQRWMGVMYEVLLSRIPGPIVIFIDEIDIVRSLSFPMDELFAAIRACYNARADDDAYQRLTFCLLGVATPAELVGDARLTPFNIGTRIAMEDLTPKEATLLQTGLGREPKTSRRIMARILHWTGGHPCLTQRLCKEVISSTPAASAADVDASCRRLFLLPRGERDEDNLAFVSRQLLGGSEEETTELLLLYDRILAGKPVRDDVTRPIVARLKLSGVVKAQRERLVVRNRIYACVFNSAWIRNHLPGAELRRQKSAYLRGVLRTAAVAAVMLMVVTGLAITAVRQTKLANLYLQQTRAEAARSRDLLYASDVSLMQIAYEQNDFRHLRSLLEETRSNPERGFEWFYWQGKLHDDVLTLRGHTGQVMGADFSPDNRHLLSCGEDGFVRVWDVFTGQEILSIRHPSYVLEASFSQNGRIILSNDVTEASLWDAVTGRRLARLPGYNHLEFDAVSSSGRRRDREPRISWFQTPSFRLHNQLLIVRRGGITKSKTFTLSPDGRRIVIVINHGVARLCNAESQQQIGILTDQSKNIFKAVFSIDSRRLALCNRDGTVPIWDAATGQRLRILVGHSEEVRMAAFSPDGRRIVTVGDDRTGIVWDIASGQKLAALRGHEAGIGWVCYSPNGQWIATASRDGTVKIWKAPADQQPPEPAGWRKSLLTTVLSHSGKRLFVCGADGTAEVRDAESGKTLCRLRACIAQIDTALYSPDDRKLLTIATDGAMRMWNAADGALLMTLTAAGPQVRCADFSPDGDRILAATTDNHVRVWATGTGRTLLDLIASDDRILSAVFSPDGRLIATASADKTVRLLDAATGKSIHVLTGHTERVYSVSFSPDGRRLVTGSRDGTARVWEVGTGRLQFIIEGQEAPVYAAVFSPDGRRILTGGGHTARLWDANSGRQMLVLNPNGAEVSWVAFSPDGRRIFAANGDHSLQTWSQ